MADLVNKTYGAVEERTVEERIAAAEALAEKLATVKGYSFRLKATTKGEKSFVSIYVNGKAGNPGKISVGAIGQPTFFPGDDAEMDVVDNFIHATEKAGLKLRVFTPEA